LYFYFYLSIYMYIERYLSTLTRKIHDRNRPEDNLCEAHADDIATQHAALMYDRKLASNFMSDMGQKVHIRFMQSAQPVTATSSTRYDKAHNVKFPLLTQRKPYVTKQTLDQVLIDKIAHRLNEDPTMLETYQILPTYWRIISRVKINGITRRTQYLDERRRTKNKLGSTSSFIYDNDTLGRIIYYMVVVVEDLTQENPIPLQRELVYVRLYQRHYDELGQMSYINTTDDTKNVVLTIDQIGTGTYVAAPLGVFKNVPDEVRHRQYVIRSTTGLSPLQSSQFQS